MAFTSTSRSKRRKTLEDFLRGDAKGVERRPVGRNVASMHAILAQRNPNGSSFTACPICGRQVALLCINSHLDIECRGAPATSPAPAPPSGDPSAVIPSDSAAGALAPQKATNGQPQRPSSPPRLQPGAGGQTCPVRRATAAVRPAGGPGGGPGSIAALQAAVPQCTRAGQPGQQHPLPPGSRQCGEAEAAREDALSSGSEADSRASPAAALAAAKAGYGGEGAGEEEDGDDVVCVGELPTRHVELSGAAQAHPSSGGGQQVGGSDAAASASAVHPTGDVPTAVAAASSLHVATPLDVPCPQVPTMLTQTAGRQGGVLPARHRGGPHQGKQPSPGRDTRQGAGLGLAGNQGQAPGQAHGWQAPQHLVEGSRRCSSADPPDGEVRGEGAPGVPRMHPLFLRRPAAMGPARAAPTTKELSPGLGPGGVQGHDGQQLAVVGWQRSATGGGDTAAACAPLRPGWATDVSSGDGKRAEGVGSDGLEADPGVEADDGARGGEACGVGELAQTVPAAVPQAAVALRMVCHPLLEGQVVVPDFVSPEEQAALLQLCDDPALQPPWSPWTGVSYANATAQKTRGKRWGVLPDYHRRGVAPAEHPLPPLLRLLAHRMRTQVPLLRGFQPNEANAIDYRRSRGSWLRPHVDDRILSGDVIVNLSLAGAAVMTLARDHRPQQGASGGGARPQGPAPPSAAGAGGGTGPPGEAYRVLLEPRSLQILSKAARYNFSHAIAPEDLLGERRVSITFRRSELRPFAKT